MTTEARVNFLRTIGPKLEPGGRVIRGPCGITTDESMNIYVAMAPVGWIAKLDQHGKYLMGIGFGEGKWYKKIGKLGGPAGVAVDKSGNIYAADIKLACIVMFDSQGHFLKKIGRGGSGDGEFKRPRSIHIDAAGCLWVVDAYNHRIQKLDPEGNPLFKFGSKGNKDGNFNNPYDLAFDQQGCIYVTDCENARVQKFDPEGKYLFKFGNKGAGDDEIRNPRGIALDGEQRVYVADVWNQCVKVFDSMGGFLYSFNPQIKEDDLVILYGITITRAGTVLVTDNGDSRIVVYALS